MFEESSLPQGEGGELLPEKRPFPPKHTWGKWKCWKCREAKPHTAFAKKGRCIACAPVRGWACKGCGKTKHPDAFGGDRKKTCLDCRAARAASPPGRFSRKNGGNSHAAQHRWQRYLDAKRIKGFAGSYGDWARKNCPIMAWATARQAVRVMTFNGWCGTLGRAAWNRPTRETAAERYLRRYHTDMEFRMYQIVRSQVKKAIRPSVKGSRRTLSFLGYTASELREHIERQFTRGMDWHAVRSGRVHIDHVVPRVEFDHTDAEQVRACWALSNLRPLWAEENMAKGAKRLHLI